MDDAVQTVVQVLMQKPESPRLGVIAQSFLQLGVLLRLDGFIAVGTEKMVKTIGV